MHILKSRRVLQVLDFKLQLLHRLFCKFQTLARVAGVLKESQANCTLTHSFFPLPLSLPSLQAMKGEKGIGGAVTTGDGLSEELTEEAFSK